ncbi:MAG: CDP-diacylglycerol--serine O-phosphatidyltransferase [Clostridiaceae bacterium]
MAKSAVPNIFTFANLSCGVFSIIMLFQSNIKMACIFILLAGFIDRYDGKVARFLDVSSELGKELDSLADLVSFGVAPALLNFTLYNLNKFSLIGYLIVAIFPIAGAYRLARYNTTQFDGVFTGVPITLAGSFMAIYSLILVFTIETPERLTYLTVVLMLLFSYLMVSKIKFSKL